MITGHSESAPKQPTQGFSGNSAQRRKQRREAAGKKAAFIAKKNAQTTKKAK